MLMKMFTNYYNNVIISTKIDMPWTGRDPAS